MMKKPINEKNIPAINENIWFSFLGQPQVIPPKKDNIIPP
jgi:hypothetical protein|tara:strand:+ start:383 stop:502 length:120 start_codon:yes stop_codon:yes gene_type:complete